MSTMTEDGKKISRPLHAAEKTPKIVGCVFAVDIKRENEIEENKKPETLVSGSVKREAMSTELQEGMTLQLMDNESKEKDGQDK